MRADLIYSQSERNIVTRKNDYSEMGTQHQRQRCKRERGRVHTVVARKQNCHLDRQEWRNFQRSRGDWAEKQRGVLKKAFLTKASRSIPPRGRKCEKKEGARD